MKSQLFSRIQNEKQWIEVSTKIPSRTFFFTSKRIMYTSLTAIIVFIMFWWFLLDKNKIIDFGFFSVKENSTLNGVFADYIAEIVEFNWEYSLVRDNKIVLNSDKMKTIQDWDIISLTEWTDLIFSLQDWTQAKIVWPAEFTINKTKSWYQIYLHDGKFFRIYCPECTSNVEILTPTFLISQEKSNTLDIHIAKDEDWEVLVKNNWDKAKFEFKNTEKEQEAKQIPSKLVAIVTETNTINMVEDSEIMMNFMEKNNISATFTLSTEKVELSKIKKDDSKKVVVAKNEQENKKVSQDKTPDKNSSKNDVVNSSEDKDPLLEWIKEVMSSSTVISWVIDDDVISQLWIKSKDEQRVPSINQMQVLKTNLDGFFLMNLFESIYNKDNANQNISKFADRINWISSSFWYNYKARADLSSIKSTILELKNKLENERYISPSYILQIEKVISWCDELNNPSKSSREDLKSDLPTKLRLM